MRHTWLYHISWDIGKMVFAILFIERTPMFLFFRHCAVSRRVVFMAYIYILRISLTWSHSFIFFTGTA